MLTEFESLLQRKIGLDAASIGAAAIERAVQVRLVACDMADPQIYLHYLRSSEVELQELVETVVVPETWFFRHREAFATMTRMALDEWLPCHPDGVLHLLSLPCSTGEEPFSMAMALLDSGFPSSRFRIDAVDVSGLALAQARRAVYGRNAFRGVDLSFRDRHFEAVANGHRLSETLRRLVQFEQANLFDPGLLPGAGLSDIVFCRNLLIYFDGETQERALHVLVRLMTANGLLFVGPSETGLLFRPDFVSVKARMAFAFRRASAVPATAKPEPVHPARRRATRPPPASSPVARPKPRTPRPSETSPSPADVPAPGPACDLERARRLADQGRLTEAAQHCEDHIRTEAPSAAVFYLLGVIRDATNARAVAAEAYRKALYLDPNHYEALVHLALFHERQGDAAGARTLNERARRQAQRSRA
jgi:chemotaxis protein methyltransferase WspC